MIWGYQYFWKHPNIDTPRKINMELRIHPWKRKLIIFQTIFLGSMLKLCGCNSWSVILDIIVNVYTLFETNNSTSTYISQMITNAICGAANWYCGNNSSFCLHVCVIQTRKPNMYDYTTSIIEYLDDQIRYAMVSHVSWSHNKQPLNLHDTAWNCQSRTPLMQPIQV